MAETDGLSSQTLVVWEPSARQSAFITCPCDDVAFGGARGGGKSDAVLGDWISHEEQFGRDAIGVVIRRERTQLVELIERARTIFSPLGFTWKDVDKVFHGPKGGRLRFAYLERDSDADAYQGHSYSRIYIEEAATFPSESPVNKLQATLRSGACVPCQMKVTCNPGGAGHGWVKSRYKLDRHPEGMTVFKFTFENPFNKKKVEKTRLFIPSRVTDNKFLDVDAYVASLSQVGSVELVRAWLEGDWSVVEGCFFDGWSQRNIVQPFAVPSNWMRFRSIDWGSAKPFSIQWWAVPGDDYPLEDGRVIRRGALLIYKEWYGASAPNVGLKLTLEEVAEGIKDRSHGEKYSYTVCDPSMFAQSGGPSLGERLFRAGVGPLKPGDNRRVGRLGHLGGWDQMRARIRGDGENPMLFCFSTCGDFIRTLPALQHDPDQPEDLDTSAEDHSADSARYACMSRPWTPARTPAHIDVPLNPQGKRVAWRPRSWKYLAEMNYCELEEALGITLGDERKRGHRERV